MSAKCHKLPSLEMRIDLQHQTLGRGFVPIGRRSRIMQSLYPWRRLVIVIGAGASSKSGSIGGHGGQSGARNLMGADMRSKTESIVLTESQAACLEALRDGNVSKTNIAIAANLDLRKTAAALQALEEFGLVDRRDVRRWRATRRGLSCSFKIIPDRRRRGSEKLGPAAERLLKALDHPMRANELAERLGISSQRVHQLAVKLHARGYVRFGDHNSRFDIIARRQDPIALLSRAEERVFSVFPCEYATSAAKIRSAARIYGQQAKSILARLLAAGLIKELSGQSGVTLYGITTAGLDHPQYNYSDRQAEPPSLPVRSDRVLSVLSSISDRGQARIKDIGQALKIPRQSTNALFQYLKRKSLVRKIGEGQHAPYTLTDQGHEALVEMTRRRAA